MSAQAAIGGMAAIIKHDARNKKRASDNRWKYKQKKAIVKQLRIQEAGARQNIADIVRSKNRDKDSPFFIEINSTPGTKGYVKATKTNLVKDVMTTFLNRDNWLKSKPFISIYGENNE